LTTGSPSCNNSHIPPVTDKLRQMAESEKNRQVPAAVDTCPLQENPYRRHAESNGVWSAEAREPKTPIHRCAAQTYGRSDIKLETAQI